MYFPWRCRARCSRSAIHMRVKGTPSCCGTAIECSLTGTFQLILHKRTGLRYRAGRSHYPAAGNPGRVGRCTFQIAMAIW